MDVFVFVKIRVDAQNGAARPDIADGGAGGFLHHVAEVAGELQLAAAVHDGGLDVQHLAAHACPGQAADQADLVARIEAAFPVFRRTEIGFHLPGLHRDGFLFAGGDHARRFAAEGGELALQNADAGFPRIVGDDLADRPVADAQLRSAQAVLFPLLRQQVRLRDVQLFLVGVAAELDDLHAVQKRARDRVHRVCCRDKQNVAEIQRDLKEIVAESVILLGVKDLEQRGGGVAAIVRAQLVDLV